MENEKKRLKNYISYIEMLKQEFKEVEKRKDALLKEIEQAPKGFEKTKSYDLMRHQFCAMSNYSFFISERIEELESQYLLGGKKVVIDLSKPKGEQTSLLE